MPGAAPKRKGADAERDVVRFLRRWFPGADRAYGAGRPDDVGDIIGVPRTCVQVKNTCHPDRLGSWLDETARQARGRTPVLVIKRRGHTDPADWYWLMPGEIVAHLLSQQGKGEG